MGTRATLVRAGHQEHGLLALLAPENLERARNPIAKAGHTLASGALESVEKLQDVDPLPRVHPPPGDVGDPAQLNRTRGEQRAQDRGECRENDERGAAPYADIAPRIITRTSALPTTTRVLKRYLATPMEFQART